MFAGFLDYVVYETMDHVWDIAYRYYCGIYDMTYSGTDTSGAPSGFVKRTPLSKKSKNFDR